MSALKLSTPVLAAFLVVPIACADDAQPAAAADGGSSSGGSGSGSDGTPPTTGTTATATDDAPGSSGGSTAGPMSTEGSETSPADTSDVSTSGSTDVGEGSSTDGGSSSGGSSDGGSSSGGSSDGGSSGSGSSDSGSSGSGSSDGGGSGSGSSSSDGSSSDGSSSDGSSTGAGSELDKFESPQPFGDQVAETDLVGTWALPTDGSTPGYTMKLVINGDGTFVWTEYSDLCEPSRQGTGWLWVSGSALAMLWDTFTATAPWDVMGRFGWDADAPFLTRSGYVPALGHLAITFPDAMRVAVPWGSRGYVRTVGGITIEDTWVAETELWDVPPGDDVASIVARKRYTLDIGGGDAWETINHWWFEDGIQTADPTEYYLYAYTDELNGYGTVNGEDYLYLGSSMMTYEPGENFLIDGTAPCDG